MKGPSLVTEKSVSDTKLAEKASRLAYEKNADGVHRIYTMTIAIGRTCTQIAAATPQLRTPFARLTRVRT